MTVERGHNLMTVAATVDMTGDVLYKCASLLGTIQAAGVNQIAGIIKSKASIGQGLSVCYDGITKAKVGAAINTVGYPLTSANSGFVVAANSGFGFFGRALALAASGDLCPVLVNFSNPSMWAGS